MFEWIEMFLLGVLLLTFIFAPMLERKFAPWRNSRSELAATGEIMRAIAGLLIGILLIIWMFFGR
jgi:hypothetical protein